MEMAMHSINNLKVMEVIDVNSGAKLGYIKDIKIDCDEQKIVSLILPGQKSSWFGKLDVIEIPWDKILKIGIDVILVQGEEDIQKE